MLRTLILVFILPAATAAFIYHDVGVFPVNAYMALLAYAVTSRVGLALSRFIAAIFSPRPKQGS